MGNYDPLISPYLTEQDYPDSYWYNTVSQSDFPTFNNLQNAKASDLTTDVVIIGGGYTGMSTAIHMAKNYNCQPIILEANDLAWGASGRNAGFVLTGSGRLSYSQLKRKFGSTTAIQIQTEYEEAYNRVENLIDEYQIDCDRQEPGYFKIAHTEKKFNQLTSQAKILTKELNQRVEIFDKQDLLHHMDHHDSFGAIKTYNGFGIHPLKLAQGYGKIVESLGIKVFNQATVTQIRKLGSSYEIETPFGNIKTKKIVNCANAYTPKQLTPVINNRFLPVMTTVIVTQPFSEALLNQHGLKTFDVAMDTRALKYYYRRLPDNRILFGGRGAVTGDQEHNPAYAARLRNALSNAFPGLADINIEYSWSGWINVSLDDLPHIYGEDNIFYSSGYCGAGVSFSVQGGYRLAQKVMGDIESHTHPLLTTPAPKFPLAPFRRLGQRLYYQYGRWVDSIG